MKRRPKRGQKGASAIEFALAVPVFFVVIGTIEFARSMFAANELNHLAREAVRYASVRSADSDAATDSSDLVRFVRRNVAGMVADEIQVASNWIPANRPGAFVEVRLNYRFEPVVPFLPDSIKTFAVTPATSLATRVSSALRDGQGPPLAAGLDRRQKRGRSRVGVFAKVLST